MPSILFRTAAPDYKKKEAKGGPDIIMEGEIGNGGRAGGRGGGVRGGGVRKNDGGKRVRACIEIPMSRIEIYDSNATKTIPVLYAGFSLNSSAVSCLTNLLGSSCEPARNRFFITSGKP